MSGAAHTWSARPVRPSAAVGVVAVFAAFMGFAWFGVHSLDAVKALAGAAMAALIAMVPGLIRRVEYRLDADGVARRPVRQDGDAEWTRLFAWADLERIQRTRTGFRYRLAIDEQNGLRRFLVRHFSDRAGGEIHVEPADRHRIEPLMARRSPELA